MTPLAFIIFRSAIVAGASIVIVALGELLAEKTGVLNLGLEGIMLMGAVVAVATVNGYVQNPYAGLLAATCIGALLGAIFAIATVLFKANQALCGLGMNFIGAGLSGLIGASFAGQPTRATFSPIKIPFLSDLNLIGNLIFNHTVLVYLGYVVLPVFIYILLFRTRHGLDIRTVGENPLAADATGINVDKIRFLYTTLGGALAGVGGAYITLAHTPAWAEGVTAGRGWIAIALVIFAGWKPFMIVVGALVFGAVTSLGYIGQLHSWPINASFLSIMPYLSTLVLMIIPLLLRKKAELKIRLEPTFLGIPYNRGE
ncbi:MAG: ABC transporter permease [Anaerolineales bacterium]|nr:ABC transporter permease [Anaerolineales bacterium]